MGIHHSFFICLFLMAAVATKGLQASIQAQNKSLPSLIGCYSRDLVTFRCRWDVRPLWNLTEPGELRLFYMQWEFKGDNTWYECPSYSTTGKNECYFDSKHARIWTRYAIQLRSRTNVVYSEMFFSVEEIVFPDPPEVLNWTLLSLGPIGLFCDVILSWDTPPSAADIVKIGWMTLEYETQYRQKNKEQWISLDISKETQAYIYGLQSDTAYEVRVRSKMRGYNFGEFTDSIFILVSSEGSRIPVTAVLILMAIAIGIMLILIVVSRKQKLMVILLPPVPGPKIKGIDPLFPQKGQTEFTSVLSAHPDLRPEFYSNDPWVEFIQVDIDEPTEMIEGLDTPLLFGESCVTDSSPTSTEFQDDDSGRASCCDPDLFDHDHHDAPHPSTSTQDGFHTLRTPANLGASQPVVPHAKEPGWQNSTYSQVAEVMPFGETLLCPEQNMTDTCNFQVKAAECKEKKPWLMVTLNDRGYSVNEQSSCTANPESESSRTPQQWQNPNTKPETSPIDSAFPILSMPTPPEYTMVDGVGWKDSLLLKTSSAAASTLSAPKSAPNPEGYFTPDLLHSMTQFK